MLIEAETIPYEPASLRGERLLVLAPHPDDEVIGCGGLTALHLVERRQVRIAVATDGAGAGDASLREEESRRGIAMLGDGAVIEFLRFPDRGLDEAVAEPIARLLSDYRPDLILVPSPVEIHPDHLALSRHFCELIQRDAAIAGSLAVTRIAFYEVSQPLRPNAIVDISEVAEAKYAAIAEHRSQLALRDYTAFARGLNAYRAMTLPPGTTAAEAYHVVGIDILATLPFSELQRRCGNVPEIEVTREPLPVTVVVRTKNRPALLREALASIEATGADVETIVVNDGGDRADTEGLPAGVRVVRHETSKGRSLAANAGAEAGSRPWLAFLDDDDLFYPEHFSVLARATGQGHAGWYSDAVSVFLRPSPSGDWQARSRLRVFATDYDPELLLIDNYIPLPTLLVRRETFLDLNGFDPDFDLFEDWDFMIRLSARGPLLRVPRITCEVRHFEGGSSVVLATPEGSERFRAAKLQVWKKHADRIDPHLIANTFEQQKRRIQSLISDLAEAAGSSAARERDVTRLEREKGLLIASGAEMQNVVNGQILRVRELEATIAALTPRAEAAETSAIEAERLRSENEKLREAEAELARTRVEIERLNGILGMIFRSSTWKAHQLFEKLRGRG